uniref:Secreted protein n=1 Tax=Ixodes ricinus TaxID=34613 RepID=A0A147BEH6_IXORI
MVLILLCVCLFVYIHKLNCECSLVAMASVIFVYDVRKRSSTSFVAPFWSHLLQKKKRLKAKNLFLLFIYFFFNLKPIAIMCCTWSL